MRRLVLIAALALAGCSSGYDTNGPCTSDTDCSLCIVCGCPQAYANADTNSATCDKISQGASCSGPDGGSCVQGPRQALCTSGHCQAVAR